MYCGFLGAILSVHFWWASLGEMMPGGLLMKININETIKRGPLGGVMAITGHYLDELVVVLGLARGLRKRPRPLLHRGYHCRCRRSSLGMDGGRYYKASGGWRTLPSQKTQVCLLAIYPLQRPVRLADSRHSGSDCFQPLLDPLVDQCRRRI